MTLSDAQALALQLMAQHGLRHDINFGTPKYWAFAFHNRRRSYGTCSYRKRTIFLSKILTPLCAEADVRDTILHEIAHALAGSEAGHSRVWKLQARAIGARPDACSTEKASVPGRWQAVCGGCGAVYHKYRKPRSTKRKACAKCCQRHNGGYWTDRFQLVYAEVTC